MFKKIIALTAAAACIFTVSQTSFAWDDSIKTVVDISGAVQIYKTYEQDENDPNVSHGFYTDKDGNKLNGLIYGDFSGEDNLAPQLLLADFENGAAHFADGFIKDSKGKRYYTQGERTYGWKKINGYWYHFDTESGYMDTGRAKICGSVYVFDKDGKWTKRLSKSGFAPKDFSVSFTGGWGGGFDTAEKKIYYGETLNGMAEENIKIPAADRQVLWCMYLESGFEHGAEILFDFECMQDFLKKSMPDVDGVYYTSVPQLISSIKVSAEEMTTDITYDSDVAQAALLDENIYHGWLLEKQYMEYYRELEKNYPYTSEEQIFYPE